MPIKLLTVGEQYDLLSKLNEEEKEFDKNLTLEKGDLYTLKHRHNIDLEPSPFETIKETIKQQPTISAIKTLKKEAVKKGHVPFPLLLEPKAEPIEPEPAVPVEAKQADNNDEIADGVDLDVVQKHGFPNPEMILTTKMDVSQITENIGHYIKTKIAPMLGNLSRANKKNTDQYAEIKREQEMLSQYKAKLETYLAKKEKSQDGGKLVVYLTSIADIQKRFLEIIGEIRAGNNNNMLKNELVGIADIMLRKGKINKKEYKQLFLLLKI